ncbi:glutathione S-transferase family protein [Pectobacteriaceae bacterium CE90]|nr:glutathione S-transferase family protein [Pectobacteriaceae bacterium CE90]
MDIILYSAKGSNSSQRVEWVLNYKAISYRPIEVGDADLTGSYLDINPFGYVPAMSINGKLIAESMAIVECLEALYPESSIFPAHWADKAKVREVCEYVNATIHSPQNRTVLRYFCPDLTEEAKRKLRGQWITQCLGKLAPILWKTSRFAVGHHFSLADIYVATIYKKLLQYGTPNISCYDDYLTWLRSHAKVSASEPKT